jgi:hypothetical protein
MPQACVPAVIPPGRAGRVADSVRFASSRLSGCLANDRFRDSQPELPVQPRLVRNGRSTTRPRIMVRMLGRGNGFGDNGASR